MPDAPAPPRRLAGADLVLVTPPSLADRWDVALASADDATRSRAAACALGLAWPRFHRRKPFTGNALKYGGLVIDTLLAEGATYSEIMAAGNEALALALTDLVVVDPALPDFSEPPAAPDGATSGG